MRGKDLLRRGALPLEQRYYGNARIFRDDQLARGAAPLRPRGAGTPTSPRRTTRESAGWDPVARMQHVDLFTWLRGDILVKADKMTMANSLELRVPFLDPEVFAVARRCRWSEKMARGDHEVRAAPGAGRHRPRARAEPAQAGLPGADPALAARRDVRLGARDRPRLPGRPPRRPGRRAAAARRAPRRAGGPQPPDLDAAGVPALARDLRRGPDPARGAGAGLPRR